MTAGKRVVVVDVRPRDAVQVPAAVFPGRRGNRHAPAVCEDYDEVAEESRGRDREAYVPSVQKEEDDEDSVARDVQRHVPASRHEMPEPSEDNELDRQRQEDQGRRTQADAGG